MAKKLTPEQEIYQALTTQKHRYRRESLLAGDKEKITSKFHLALVSTDPVEFMMFWGQGERDNVAAPEEMAVDFLSKALGNVSSRVETSVNVNFVFCDSHIKFNGYEFSPNYKSEVGLLVSDTFKQQEGVLTQKSHLMSEIAGYTPTQDGKSFKEFARFTKEAQSVEVDPITLKQLVFGAKNNYKGDLDPVTAAKAYYLLNLFENKPLAREFEGGIFLTYNSKKHAFVIPEGMPTIFMHSMNKNTSAKPWFTHELAVEPVKMVQEPKIVGVAPTVDKGGVTK